MDEPNKRQIKRDYLWNTLGSVMSAASSVLLLMIVTRQLGAYAGGLFSLAYALAQQFQVLGAYEMRAYQATDVGGKYSFRIYFTSRIVTCVCMAICVIVYVLVIKGAGYEAMVLLAVASLRLFDAFEDVFHGAFQQNGRLDIAGRALFFRVFCTTCAFWIGVSIFNDLVSGCLVAFLVSAVVMSVCNFIPARRLLTFSDSIELTQVIELLKTCLPLFLGAFLSMYLVNAPRFGIEQWMSVEDQAYYSILFMPALVINLLSSFVFKPLLATMAHCWVGRDKSGLRSILAKGCVGVAVAFVIISLIAYPLGIPVLELLYGVSLGSYRWELMTLLLGGAFNAISVILYYGLVTMRCQRFTLMGYAIAAGFAFVAATPLISTGGMMGAVLLYDLSMLVACLVFLMVSGVVLHRMKENDSGQIENAS